MTERKPITADLRRWWELHCRALATPELDEGLDALCGAVDAVHANLEGENESLRRELDRALGEWDYWDSTHVELPKDADGVPIRIGDMMDFSKNVRGLTVVGIGIVDADDSSSGVFVREGHDYVWYNAKFLRHHVQTVEGLIRDAIGRCIGHLPEYWDEPIAECAAKLRLAGDAE